MAEISKITTPNGSSYDLKDAAARLASVLNQRFGEWTHNSSSSSLSVEWYESGPGFAIAYSNSCGSEKGSEDSTLLTWTDDWFASETLTATRPSSDDEWTLSPPSANGYRLFLQYSAGHGWAPHYWSPISDMQGDSGSTELVWYPVGHESAVSGENTWEGSAVVTATRTALPVYILGSQTDKPLAAAEHTHTKSQISDFPVLATVATSGSYSDLSNKPTIPTVGTLNTTASTAQSTNASESLSGSVTLHKVSKTGSYNDLSNKPTIPAAQVQTDWNATSGMGVLLNKPTNLQTTSNLVTSLSSSSTDSQYPSAKCVHDGLAGKADASHTHSSIESPNGSHALELANSGAASITGMGPVSSTDATYDLSSFETGASVTIRWPVGATDTSSFEIIGSVGIANPSYVGPTIFSDGDYWGELDSLVVPDSLAAMFFVLSAGTTTGPVVPSSTVSVLGPATVQTDANLVTSLSSSSTDTQYPSAKCVYDAISGAAPGLTPIGRVPSEATSYEIQPTPGLVYVAEISSNQLQLSLPDIPQDTVLPFELWLDVQIGATGSVSYLHDLSSMVPVQVGSLAMADGFCNKIAIRLINDDGTYSLEENVYFQRSLA